jgi:hypothetical protein
MSHAFGIVESRKACCFTHASFQLSDIVLGRLVQCKKDESDYRSWNKHEVLCTFIFTRRCEVAPTCCAGYRIGPYKA